MAQMKKIMSPKFRVSFPALFTPRAFEEGKKVKYGVTMLIPKTTDISEMRALAQAVALAKWPDEATRPKLRNPFRDGDAEKPDLEGYPGHWFIKATSQMQPGIVDSAKMPLIEERDVYAGCYAKATLTVFSYDHPANKGVSFGLQNLMKLAEGEEFSGRSSADEDFEAVETDEDGLASGSTPAGATASGDSMFA